MILTHTLHLNHLSLLNIFLLVHCLQQHEHGVSFSWWDNLFQSFPFYHNYNIKHWKDILVLFFFLSFFLLWWNFFFSLFLKFLLVWTLRAWSSVSPIFSSLVMSWASSYARSAQILLKEINLLLAKIPRMNESMI